MVEGGQRVSHSPGARHKMQFKLSVGDKKTEVFSCRFDSDDKYIATGCQDGSTRVYNILSGKCTGILVPKDIAPEDIKFPITQVRWFPGQKNPGLLTAVSSDGWIRYWDTLSGKCLDSFQNEAELPDLYAFEFNKTAKYFACGGKEGLVKIYDEATHKLASVLRTGGEHIPGHTNRVFSIKWTDDPNVLISAGWDNLLIIWDLRNEIPISSLYGPHICGDSIDVQGDTIVTGSYRSTNALQFWSIKEQKIIQEVDWELGSSYLYTAKFNKIYGDYVLAGGATKNEAKLFDKNNNFKPMISIASLSKPVTDCDFCHMKETIAVASTDGLVRIFNLHDVQMEGTTSGM